MLALLVLAPAAHAAEFPMPEGGAALFGVNERVVTRYQDTLIELARRYNLGYEELLRVNPGIDPWLPGEGTQIFIPGQRILPPGPAEGIVVNLPEHRLYYFPKAAKGEPRTVLTFPVSVGKMDWRTPLGTTRIKSKTKNPTWFPPESVRREHRERGDPLPASVPPGKDNPLGSRAMRLDIARGSYLIHGTNNPDAVGMPVTHGCLRLYPEDVERLFDVTPVNTTVRLINEPLKMASVDGRIWLEVHPPVDDQGQQTDATLEDFEKRLDLLLGVNDVAMDWDAAIAALKERSGVPAMVGLELHPETPPGPAAPAANVVPTEP
jgi:L,D-transpeptidase ErfK/SrfK